MTTANLVGLAGAILTFFCLFAIPGSQYWNIRLPLYLIVAVWTILRPRVALYLLPFAVPWGSLDTINLGASLTSADILVGLLAASWLLGFALRPLLPASMKNGPLDREEDNLPGYLPATILLLLLAMLVSTTVAISLAASLKEIVKWLELLVVVLLGAQYIRTRQQIWALVVILCLAAITQAFYGYAQAFLNLGPASFIRDSSLRVYTTFGQPNPLAGYLNMSLMITLALALLGSNWTTRFLATIATAILGGAEFLTQSKGGWLALIVSTLFIIVVGVPHFRKLMGLLGIACLALGEAFLAGKIPSRLYTPLLVKLGMVGISFTSPSPDNYANSERVAHWYVGIRMFLDHPFLGVGIGNYEPAYAPYAPGIFVIPLGHAHNYFINIAAEAGLFGLFAFVLFIAAIFVVSARTVRTLNERCRYLKKRIMQPTLTKQVQKVSSMLAAQDVLKDLSILVNDRALAIGLAASLLSVSVHNLVDNLYVHGMTILFALLLVLLLRLHKGT
jgi:O-antigen ligase